MSGQRRPVAPAKHAMDVQRRVAVRPERDIPGKGGDLNLFVDRVAAVFLGCPVEISQGCTGKCPDRRELRSSNMFALRECLQARHCLLAGREHNGDCALLAVRIQGP